MRTQLHPNQRLGTNDFSDEVAVGAIEDLTIVGILGIKDPLRMETTNTIAECRRAGARFFMATGDYGLTTAAIARNIGFFGDFAEPDGFDDICDDVHNLGEQDSHSCQSLLLDGTSIARLTNHGWDVVCGYDEIAFARNTPEQKLRIVNLFRDRDNVVAVASDGTNDCSCIESSKCWRCSRHWL